MFLVLMEFKPVAPNLSGQEPLPLEMEAVFVETLLGSGEDLENHFSLSSSSDAGTGYQCSLLDDGETCAGLSSRKQLNHEESWDPSNWDMDLSSPSVEAKELETVFEDDILSDCSSYHERSGSICSMPPVLRDRSGSTWSTMTLCDYERSTDNTVGFRERSYSSTSACHEANLCGVSANHHHPHSSSSGYRQRSASIGSVLPNPLEQSHRLSIQCMKSAFTFLDLKGELFVCRRWLLILTRTAACIPMCD